MFQVENLPNNSDIFLELFKNIWIFLDAPKISPCILDIGISTTLIEPMQNYISRRIRTDHTYDKVHINNAVLGRRYETMAMMRTK